jgi:hypothetical protein
MESDESLPGTRVKPAHSYYVAAEFFIWVMHGLCRKCMLP